MNDPALRARIAHARECWQDIERFKEKNGLARLDLALVASGKSRQAVKALGFAKQPAEVLAALLDALMDRFRGAEMECRFQKADAACRLAEPVHPKPPHLRLADVLHDAARQAISGNG